MYVAYDLFDRVVMTQDSNLRATNQWAYVKYDGQSRPYRSGVITTTLIKDSVWAQAARSTNYPTLSGTYTIMTEAYYDDYSWTTGTPLNNSLVTSHINSYNFSTSYNTSLEYAQQITATNRVRGSVTGAKKLILGTSTYLYSLILYDENGRPVQIKQTNYTSGTDVVTSQYSFAGRKLRTHLQQQKSGANAQTHTLLTKYSYDHVGRLKTIIKNIDSTGDKTVNRLAYNELGQLQSDSLGNNLTTQNYEYNVRGWLQSINKGFIDTAGSTSAYFGEALFYDWGFTNNQYDGTIAGAKWKSAGDGIARAYGFTYDNANRLTAAEFSQQNEGRNNWTNDKVDFTTNNLTYDAGGNILTMRQRGLSIGSSVTIDSLSYQYFINSNQLQNVSDLSAFGATNGGLDFKDTTITGVNDYSYDVNGNIAKDYNRKMYTASNGNGTVYNLLDKPDSIAIRNKATVYYYYDASGMMLSKKVNDYSSGSLVSQTYLYLNGFVYKNDTVQYTLFEEGRIRYNKDSSKFFYDYFLKDHLGNVRTVLTEEKRTDAYAAATLETANLATERILYSKIDSGRVNKSGVAGYPTDNYTNPNDYVQKLGTNGIKVGTGIVLKVMAGDQFNLRVSSWWNSNNSPGTPANPLNDIIAALASGIAGVGAGGHPTTQELTSSAVLSPNVTSFLNSRSYNSSLPKAYLNWILFDEQFNYVSNSSGFQQVGSSNTFTVHTQTNLPIKKNGYLYVYVSNETPNIDVFFDNLQVTHIRGPLLQTQGYYPFGLEMSGISSNALNFGSPNNAYKSNGGDEWEESINLYSTFFREYDPQLGRFYGVDILSEQSIGMSAYQFCANNPIMFHDPLGNYLHNPTTFYGDYFDHWQSSSSYEHMFGTGGGLFSNEFAGGGGGGGGVGGPVPPGQYSDFWNSLWNSVPAGTKAFFANGPITTNMVANYFAITWGAQASNVTATAVAGGFQIGGVAISTGNAITDYFQSNGQISSDFQYLSDLFGSVRNSGSLGMSFENNITPPLLGINNLRMFGSTVTASLGTENYYLGFIRVRGYRSREVYGTKGIISTNEHTYNLNWEGRDIQANIGPLSAGLSGPELGVKGELDFENWGGGFSFGLLGITVDWHSRNSKGDMTGTEVKVPNPIVLVLLPVSVPPPIPALVH